MVEEKIETIEKEIAKDIEKIEEKVEAGEITQEEANKEIERDVEEKTEDVIEEKKENKKAPVKKKGIAPKDVAIANAYSVKISDKHSKFICKIIKGKTPDAAIVRLQEVISHKRAVPMAGLEVAHQKGKGLSGAKFPKNACIEIIEVIKQVKANAVVNGIENPIITIAQSNRASRPFRRSGQKGKRTHLHLEVKDRTKLK